MKRIRKLLPESIEQAEALKGARAYLALRDWDRVVGPILAEHCQPERFERGTLWVASNGSAWAQEMRLLRDKILYDLNALAKEFGLFTEMRVGVRPFTPLQTFEPPKAPTEPSRPQEGTILEIAERRLKNWPHESGD